MEESLTARVQALEDRLDILQLVAQYGPDVDSGAGDATAALWTEDGTFEAVPQKSMRGHAGIAEMVQDPRHLAMLDAGCAHVLTAPHVQIDGDTATGRSHALQIRRDGDGFRVVRLSANTWRFVRTPLGWRIAERVNAPLDGTPGHRQLLSPRGEA